MERASAVQPILTSRQYAWLTLGFLTVAVYGSLVPFHFRSLPLDEAISRYREALSQPLRIESRSDWVSNILLFIPLGFVFMATLAVDRARQAGWIAALVVLPTCTLSSAAIEFTQLFFPPRVSHINDVVAESIGSLLGTALWLLGGQRITLWVRRLWVDLGGQSAAQPLLVAYTVILVWVHVVPLDLTISPVELYRKYQQKRVYLIPFASWRDDVFQGMVKSLTNMAFFLPVGALLAGLSHPFWQRRRNWLPMLGLGLTLAGLIEFMQLFVFTRTCDATDVVTGGLAVLLGWIVGLYCQQPRTASWSNTAHTADMPAIGSEAPGTPAGYWVLAGWFALLVAINWQPFNFNLSPQAASQRFAALSWLPFADYQQGDYLHAFDEICSKMVLFLPLGALLAFNRFGESRRHAVWWMVALAVGLTTLLEAGQLLLPTRYASISDVLIETLAISIGFLVVRRSLAGRQVYRGSLSGT
jgi:glycopeptide antibiotics resistance protein